METEGHCIGSLVTTFIDNVPQIHPPPPFATLALAQNAGGADVTISLAIMPSIPVKHDLIVGGGLGTKREASQSVRQRDAPDATSRLTSFSVQGARKQGSSAK